MKKALTLMVGTLLLASCDQLFKSNQNSEENYQLDSLQSIIDQKDDDLNEMMDAFNEIQAGFDEINEAEGRVNLLNESAEGNNVKANIQENMEFIENVMEENRRKIAELEEKLKSSSLNSTKLQETLNKLTAQLQEKTKEIDELKNALAERDVKIQELDESVNKLTQENTQVKAEKDATTAIAQKQDAQLNTAWYVFGTNKELKNHKIIVDGDVLKSKDFDAEYFTKIDIRNTTVIPLNSKSAKLLTTHPQGSYSLLKDGKGEYTLRITNPTGFWSVSKYLVIRVK